MTLTREMLDKELAAWFRNMRNSDAAKGEILALFSEESGDGNVWSEQDIWEQSRKVISRWNNTKS